MIESISIHGLRGFGKLQTINFAIPNGEEGSGLTIFVGANNSGKTTILEALRSFNVDENNLPSFSERKRNIRCENGRVHLKIKLTSGEEYGIDTIKSGGSTTQFTKHNAGENPHWTGLGAFVLQSRRFVDYEFYRSDMSRDAYLRNQQANIYNRTPTITEFNSRLFKMQKNQELFNSLLKDVLGYDLEWTIEQNDSGTYFLKLFTNGYAHSSEGLGDGIWSVFTICDALYDSEAESIIAIDEPELSLHPAYQKKIVNLLRRYSKDRQIIINTHSPYFIDTDSLINGASLHRTVKNGSEDIDVFSLSDQSRKAISGFLSNINQPHTLGTEAKEIFFLEDRIILTEGQEDVIMYNKALKELSFHLDGKFFGWGSGGASNITKIAQILQDLGYKKVAAIFDGDKKDELDRFKDKFPLYGGSAISKPDVRDKRETTAKPPKEGLMTEKGKLKSESRSEVEMIFEEINSYFKK